MNAEEGEWFGRHDHPLLNQVILEKLFEYVRRRDLLTCRGVNKKWNLSTIPFMRSKFLVSIQLSDESLNHPRNPGEGSTRRMEDFVAVFIKNTLGIPFAKFRLGPFCTTEIVGQQFLQLCGDTAKEIYFCQWEKCSQVEDLSEMLRKMTKLEHLTMYEKFVSHSGNVVELFPGSKPKLSSLKSLTLEYDAREDPKKSCPTLLQELITAAENISDFKLKGLSSCAVANGISNVYSSVFDVLTLIEELGRESSIQKLTIEGAIKNVHVELLRRMAAKSKALKLKELSIYAHSYEEHFQLAKLFKDTLEDLRDFGSSYSSFMTFPKMPKLRHLNLQISTEFDSSLVDLNKNFPILEELVLCQTGGGQVLDEFLRQSEPCPKMKSLSLSHGLHFTINAFDHILTIFPRLTELRFGVSPVSENGAGILRQIWTRMPQLESLTMTGIDMWLQTKESMDSLFTGISIESIQEISDSVKDLDQMSAQLRKDAILKIRNQHCQLPSVGNLANLRCLVLNVSGWGNKSRWNNLSDVTGFLGFYSLKHLNHLVVRNCQLTKTCCEILTMEMDAGLESWAFTTPEREAIIPDPLHYN